MTYSSNIRLQIGEVPKTTDSTQLPDLIDIYNSIHILNQYVDSIVKKDEAGVVTPDTPGYDVAPIKNIIYGLLGQNMAAGSIVSCYGEDRGNVWYLGAPTFPIGGTKTTSSQNNGFVGITLEEGNEGDRIKIGFGPGTIRLDGAVIGQALFAYTAFKPGGDSRGNGSLYTVNPNEDVGAYSPNTEVVVVGAVIAQDSGYLYDHVDYWATQAAMKIIPLSSGGE